jgi:DNA-binding transcriptional regulator PaaX
MGQLETDARALRRRGYLQKAVLTAIGLAGILTIAAVAPNTFQILGKLGIGKRFLDKSRKAISVLARKGYVKFEEVGGRSRVRITDAGRRFLKAEEEKARLREGHIRPKRWDRRWRLVIFDVPEYRKGIRDRLRREVTLFGFLRLQDSVWVYPYDCEELVVLLKADMRIGKDVLYAIVEKIENDGWIKKHFKLVGY